MTRIADNIDPPAVDPYRYRVECAIAELKQAVEFDAGQRDWVFGDGLDLTDLRLRRHGAAMACVSVALWWLNARPPFSNAEPTISDLKWLHHYKQCGEKCPFCNGGRDL